MKRMVGLLVGLLAASAAAQGAPSVNENTGDLVYTYPLPIPTARGRHQPAFALIYSSASNSNRGYGFGWDLTATYIERDIRAPPTVSSVDPLVFTLVRGQQRDVVLCSTAAGNVVSGDNAMTACPSWVTYVRRGPLSINMAGSSWVVTDAVGTVYKFEARCGQRWYLTRVTDLLGNDYLYRPSCDGAIEEVLFDLKAGTSPASVWSNTANDGNYATRVAFEYGALTGLARGFENIAGYVAMHDRYLSKVRVLGPGRTTLHVTELSYTGGDLPLLESISEKGKAGMGSIAPTTFSYDSPQTLSFGKIYSWSWGSWLWESWPATLDTAGHVGGAEWKDVNGDGLVDAMLAENGYFYWARNQTAAQFPRSANEGGSGPQFAPFTALYPAESGGPFLDFNGDGIVDRLKVTNGADTLNVQLGVRDASGAISFPSSYAIDRSEIVAEYAAQWSDRLAPPPPGTSDPWPVETPPSLTGPHLLLEDVNGDGILDYLIGTRGCGDVSSGCGWIIYLGHGTPSGFAFKWVGATGRDVPGAPGASERSASMAAFDVNGDGLSDAVSMNPEGVPNALYGGPGSFITRFPIFGTSRANAWNGVLNPRPASRQLGTPVTVELPGFTTGFEFAPDELPPINDIAYVPAYWINCLDSECAGIEYVPCPGTFVGFKGVANWAFTDANGDGIADLVRDGKKDALEVLAGTGVYGSDPIPPVVEFGVPTGRRVGMGIEIDPTIGGFHPASTKMAPQTAHGDDCHPYQNPPAETVIRELVDLNGDGIPDYRFTGASPPQVAWGSYGGALEVARPALLRSLTTPLGALHQVTYRSSKLFGAKGSIRPVVVKVRTTGWNIPETNSRYWYLSNPQTFTLPYSEGRVDDRGFATTTVEQVEARWARRTDWYQTSHALAGVPQRVQEGAVTASRPEGGTAPVEFRTVTDTTSTMELKSASSSTCSTSATAPILLVQTRAEKKRQYGAANYTADVTTVACSDVDTNGVVLKQTSQASINGLSGSQLVTTVALGATLASCKGIGASVTTEAKVGTAILSLAVADYNSLCQKTAEYGLVSGVRQNLRSFAYGAFGLPASTSEGGIARVYSYDTTGRFLESEKTCETVACNTRTRLVTTHEFDPETGLKKSSTGPIIEGVVDRTDWTKRYYLYDAFGRVLAIAKNDFTGSGGSAGVTPSGVTQVTNPVEAHVYSDLTKPAGVTSYRFAAAVSYSIDAMGTQAVPVNNSVVASISYLDDLGREVQVRERLGVGTGAAPGNVVRGSTNWLVTKALLFDGAGRVKVAWDRFESTSGAFDSPFDGLVGNSTGTKASVTNYDDEGRPWCNSVEWAANYSAPTGLTPAGLCTSDSTESPTFALRTQTSYDIGVVSARGPYGGYFVRTTTTPPELNVPNRSGSFRTLAGPRGEVLGTVDPELRYTWVERDALGREAASWREGLGLTTPVPASTVTYDTAGQVTSRWDANMPGSVTNYTIHDSFGRVQATYPDARYQDRVEYYYGDLGRVTEVREISARNGTTRSTTNWYDKPYEGPIVDADKANYTWTEGRLAWTDTKIGGVSITTIAYGYDDAGRLTRRDQWIEAMPWNATGTAKRVSVSTTYGFDGRVLDSTLVNPYQATGEPNPKHLKYTLEYDSFGRTADIKGRLGAMTSDETFYTADGYDALGRPSTMTADGQRGRSVRAYGTYSGALTGECKRIEGSAGTTCSFSSGTPLFGTENAKYQGTQLLEFTDRETKSKYTYEYFTSGKLKTAKAQPQTGYTTAAQAYSQELTFNGIGNLATDRVNANDIAGRVRSDRTQTFIPAGAPPVVVDRIAYTSTAVAFGSAPPPEKVQYTYDVVNRLTSVTRNGVSAESLIYGPTGELLYRRVGDQFFFYIGEYATATGTCSGVCTPAASTMEMDAHIVYAGTRIASARWKRANGQATGNPVGRVLYYYRSRMGSVVATSQATLAGTAGAPVVTRGLAGAKYQYTPYGEVDTAYTYGDSGDTRSELGYTNALRLTGSLLHLKARVYDAALRVFVQADTVDRLRYAYVACDPVNLSDPTGLMAIGHFVVDPAIMSNWGGPEVPSSMFSEYGDAEGVATSDVHDGDVVYRVSNSPAARAELAARNPAPPAAAQAESQTLPGPGGTNASAPSRASILIVLASANVGGADLQQLTSFADKAAKAARKGETTDLEALARTVDFAAKLYGSDRDTFVRALGLVVAGVDANELTKELTPLSPWFGQTGFAPQFQEPQWGASNNQSRHFMAFVVAGYATGGWPGGSGAAAMSVVNGMREATGGASGSFADFLLGQAGIALGYPLYLGVIGPPQAGAWIRTNLGVTP